MRLVALGMVIGALVAGLASGCSSSMEHQSVCSWNADTLRAERQVKDAWLRSSPHSPIPEEQKVSFAGLSYYPPDPAFVFRARLEIFPDPDTVILLTTYQNDVRKMLRFGKVHFEYRGQPLELTVYRYTGKTAERFPYLLFIPFKDATNGRETYEGGRYLDLEYSPGQQWYCLDFNRAYNPYCVYNDQYSCPLVPEENVLNVAIRAGEKNWKH